MRMLWHLKNYGAGHEPHSECEKIRNIKNEHLFSAGSAGHYYSLILSNIFALYAFIEK